MKTKEKYAEIRWKLLDVVAAEYDIKFLRSLDMLLQDVHRELSVKIADSVTPAAEQRGEEPGRRNTDKHTHASGVTRSHKTPGYDQIPTEFLQCVAERFDHGRTTRKEEELWQNARENTLEDTDFYRVVLGHMFEHTSKLMNKDLREDDEWGHIGAISWGAAVWAWWLKNREHPREHPSILRACAHNWVSLGSDRIVCSYCGVRHDPTQVGGTWKEQG